MKEAKPQDNCTPPSLHPGDENTVGYAISLSATMGFLVYHSVLLRSYASAIVVFFLIALFN